MTRQHESAESRFTPAFLTKFQYEKWLRIKFIVNNRLDAIMANDVNVF